MKIILFGFLELNSGAIVAENGKEVVDFLDGKFARVIMRICDKIEHLGRETQRLCLLKHKLFI